MEICLARRETGEAFVFKAMCCGFKNWVSVAKSQEGHIGAYVVSLEKKDILEGIISWGLLRKSNGVLSGIRESSLG